MGFWLRLEKGEEGDGDAVVKGILTGKGSWMVCMWYFIYSV